jgi:RNA polymerase sigma-70 factor (ECF subfamily)
MSTSRAVGNWIGGLRGSRPGEHYEPTLVNPVSQPAAGAFADCRTPAERFDAEAMPHMTDLYRTAIRIVGDATRAEDVLQEAYLQAWKSFGRFEPGTNCRAWLFKILFHCVNHQRRKWFRFSLLKEPKESLESTLVANTPVPEKLTDGEILAALDRIPMEFRAVVVLSDVEEFTYREVAEILSVPMGTVMSRLSRGRKLLREQLVSVAQSYGIVKPAEQEQR